MAQTVLRDIQGILNTLSGEKKKKRPKGIYPSGPTGVLEDVVHDVGESLSGAKWGDDYNPSYDYKESFPIEEEAQALWNVAIGDPISKMGEALKSYAAGMPMARSTEMGLPQLTSVGQDVAGTLLEFAPMAGPYKKGAERVASNYMDEFMPSNAYGITPLDPEGVPEGFYSKLDDALDNLRQDKNLPQDVGKYLQGRGVSRDEMEDVGLLDYLKEKSADRGRVTRQELIDHIEENRPEIGRHVLGGEGAADEVDFSDYELSQDNASVYDDLDGIYGRAQDYEYELDDSEGWLQEEVLRRLKDQDNITDEQAAGISKALESDGLRGVEGLFGTKMRDDVFQKLEDIASEEYYDNPYYEWSVSGDGPSYNVFGSDDIGYTITRDGDRIESEVWDLDEVNVQIRTDLEDGGYITGEEGATKWSDYQLEGGKNYREILVTSSPTDGGDYYAPHFDEENIAAHVRVNDRVDADGKNMLFIEELQSDWHQAGREHGYETARPQLQKKIEQSRQRGLKIEKEIDSRYKELLRGQGNEMGDASISAIAYHSKAKDVGMTDEFYAAKKEFEEAQRQLRKIVPDTIMKDDKWQEHALKHAILGAIEDGQDRVAWKPAKHHVDQWSEKYSELYKTIYDKKLPGTAKRLANQYGGKVGKTQIDVDGDMETVSYIEITPEMKKRIQQEGMPLYSAGASGGLLATLSDEEDNRKKRTEEPGLLDQF